MAVETPEEVDFYVTTRDVLRLTKNHRDRLQPLCAVDPRHRYPGEFDPYPIIEHYVDQGSVGLGENLCGLPVDDPLQQRVYESCDRLGLPVVMHFDHWINRDQPGLTGLENMLTIYQNVRFVGHAQYFWREISAQVDPDVDFPAGAVVPGGRIEELFGRHPNLYADLSAGSGYGAITRDPEFGLAFMERWKHRLMFGTDTVNSRPTEFGSIVGNPPILDFIQSADLSEDTVERITRKNAEKVFRL